MTYAQKLKKGTSSCVIDVCYEDFKRLHDVGVECLELSTNFKGYTEVLRFTKNYDSVAEMAERAGLELWSIHLPFSRSLDISSAVDEGRELCMKTNLELIDAAAKAGFKTVVLHPSSEPITDEARPSRLAQSRESILITQERCAKNGLTLAVENLPRTCLCNKASEMVELLRGTGACAVFDTNHSLIQQNPEFLAELCEEIKVATLHISDYDFIDERHRLPGDGINDWKAIFAILEKHGYNGPMMYEVGHQPKDRDITTVEALGENMIRLAAGEI